MRATFGIMPNQKATYIDVCTLVRKNFSAPLLPCFLLSLSVLPPLPCHHRLRKIYLTSLAMAAIRETVELHLRQFAKEKMGMEVSVQELYISLATVLLATFLFFLLGKDLPLLNLLDFSPMSHWCLYSEYEPISDDCSVPCYIWKKENRYHLARWFKRCWEDSIILPGYCYLSIPLENFKIFICIHP